MVICKYFLQGTCKFGNNCKFRHEVPDNIPTSTIQSSVIKPQSKDTLNENLDCSNLIKSIKDEMKEAVNGLHWFLTCYGPVKEKPAFPGFEDTSLEEVRLGYYESKKSNTQQQYMLDFQSRMNNALSKFTELQYADNRILPILLEICGYSQSADSENYTQQSQLTNSNPTVNIFNTNKPYKPKFRNIFDQSNIQPAQSDNIFRTNNTGNIFAREQPEVQSHNIFALPPPNVAVQSSSNIFANRSTDNIFAVNNQQLSKPNFGPSPFTNPSIPTMSTQSNTNIFAQSIFQTSSNQNSFKVPQGDNIFAKSTNENIFAIQPIQSTSNQQFVSNPTNQLMKNSTISSGNIFAQSQTSSGNLFTNQNFAATGNIFANSTPQNASNSIFGTPSVFQKIDIDESVYSKLEELDEQALKWFESNELDIYDIPINPPTYSMCFKI